MTNFNTLGAALMLAEIPEHYDWLNQGNRDLEVQDFFDFDLLDGVWEERGKEINTLLASYTGRVGIHGPFWGMNLANPDPLLRGVTTQRLMQGLAAAELVSATHMVIHSPVDPWMHRHIVNDKERRAKTLDFMEQTMAEPIAKAEEINCVLVMEDIMDVDPRLQLELIQHFNTDALRMSIDIGHAYCMHIQHGAPPPDQFVEEAGEFLAHVHIQDTDGYLDRHWLPGQGGINFTALFEALAKIKAEPRLIIEVKEKSKIQDAHAWLQNYIPSN